MKLTTVEQLRECRAANISLFRVTYLPYLEGIDPETNEPFPRGRGYGYGFSEDLYTEQSEAQTRYDTLNTATEQVENDTLELTELRYPANGGWCFVSISRSNGEE